MIENLLFLKFINDENGYSRRTQYAARRIIQRRYIWNRRSVMRCFKPGVNLRQIPGMTIEKSEQMNNRASACLIKDQLSAYGQW